MKQINANLQRATEPPVLKLDNGHEYTAILESPSRCRWELPDSETGGANVLWDGKRGRLIVPPVPGSCEADLPPVLMDPKTLVYGATVKRLTTSGRDFILNGQRWLWKGSSDFRLYQWFLDGGHDITGLLHQRQDAGANLLRVFGMYNGGIGRFIPAEYGERYWGEWLPFLAVCADVGFQVEVTAFADCQTFDLDQQGHWARLGSVLPQAENVVCELVNEYKQNGVDPGRFGPLPGVLCSRGSGLSDEPGYMPGWQYHTWHGRRDWPKVLFSAEDMWYVGEGASGGPLAPVVHDEPIGFADADQPGRRSADPYVARVLGQTGAAYGAGATLHSDYGIQSQLWSPTVDNCARVFFNAIR